MAYQLYNKLYRTPEQLISYLKTNNLLIGNEENAIQILEDINYFRFKSYLRPFLNNECHKYSDNSKFEDAYEIYKFDIQLRNDLFLIISRIEIKLRSKLDQIVTTYKNDIFWYLNKNNFIQSNNNKLDILARKFGAKNMKELNSWINLIRDVRNKCAHHSRVWNANYRSIIGFGINDNRITIVPSNRNRIYMIFCILNIITKTLKMDIDIKIMIDNYITKYPIFNFKINSCGFPNNWIDDDFWK